MINIEILMRKKANEYPRGYISIAIGDLQSQSYIILRLFQTKRKSEIFFTCQKNVNISLEQKKFFFFLKHTDRWMDGWMDVVETSLLYNYSCLSGQQMSADKERAYYRTYFPQKSKFLMAIQINTNIFFFIFKVCQKTRVKK